MANITPYLTAIRTARYGEEVRGSIADALEAVNDQVESDTASAGTYATSASSSADSAASSADTVAQIASDLTDELADLHSTETAIEDAEAARVSAENARVVAEQGRASAATGYVAQAQAYANQAAQYASSDNATLSKSWAVGGTSTRYGEETNNSKYWAEVAAQVVTEGGVASFNGRTGNVSPEDGDYASEQITYGSGTVKGALDGFVSTAESLDGRMDALEGSNILIADDDATPTGDVDFTSVDTESTPSSTESVELLSASDAWSARLYKISQMFKNIRYLLKMLGTTNISSIGGGTVTGAISALNGKISGGYMAWANNTVANASWATHTGNNSSGVLPGGGNTASSYNFTLNRAGTYLVTYHVNFDIKSTTGIRGVRFYENESSVGEEFAAAASNGTSMTVQRVVESNGTKAIRMGLYQNSGSSGTAADIFIAATKIA